MFLPIGDSPNPRGTAHVTWALLVLNVAVYVLFTLPLGSQRPPLDDPLLQEYLRMLAGALDGRVPLDELYQQTSRWDLFVFQHGFRPAEPTLRDLFASMFLHANFLHLAGNMLFLWIYGDNVEHRLGRGLYLGAYLGTGVAATCFHWAFDVDSPLPMVGASGAISGVLGLYFLYFPRNVVRVAMVFFPFLMDVITVPARLVLGFYLLVDNLLPFMVGRGMGGGGVAHGAHIGGFLGGLGLAWLLERRRIAAGGTVRPDGPGEPGPRAWGRPAPPETPHRSDESPREAVRRALDEGRRDDAARLASDLDDAGVRHLLTPQEALALATWQRRQGHPEVALSLYRRLLRDAPHREVAAAAHLGAALVHLEDLGQPTPASQHLLDALDLSPEGAVARRARDALGSIGSLRP